MKNKPNKKKFDAKSRNKGFSLVEVLIAVGILVLIAAVLAVNMLSSSQLNGTAKQVASSSDLTTAIMEVMQSVDLSDVLTDVNGGDSDEYGTKLSYLLTKNTLKNYDQTKMKAYEVHDLGNGQYQLAVKQGEGDAALDPTKITSSIRTRVTGAAQRNYFVGQKNDWDNDGKLNEYAFLIQNVENDEMNVDILATVVPEQTFSIVNITSMEQTEVLVARQDKTMDDQIAREFKKSHDMYVALKSGIMTIDPKEESWFLNNMQKTITVDIKKDTFSEATTIIVSATYTVDTTSLAEKDKTIKQTIATFSTNSTSEFARGIYVYFYPMLDNKDTGYTRDHFVINNKNELSTPVYLIALSRDAGTNDFSNISNYEPSLTVNELSSQIYTDRARTTVCSNIDNSLWKSKTLNPADDRLLEVKTLGNLTEQQTLYSISVKIYAHKDGSLDGKVFTPRDKDLLVETTGTFIDASELLDISSDSTSGDATAPQKATVGTHQLVYNGELQTGVYGVGIEITGGVAQAQDAGAYEAKVTPKPGYYWEDGSDGTRNVSWSIARAKTAKCTVLNPTYNGEKQSGIDGQWLVTDGVTEAIDHGYYTAYVQPDQNHAWEDGTYGKKTISWTMNQRPVTIQWFTGDNLDVWSYDGIEHSGTYTLDNIVIGDIVVPIEKNNKIKDVGEVTAAIVGFSDNNYCVPAEGATHTLTITVKDGAYVKLNTDLVYNGIDQKAVKDSVGVVFSGHITEINAKTYTFTATLEPGYQWAEGNPTGSRVFTWTIQPRVVDLSWGTSEWVYDATWHSAKYTINNVVQGDQVTLKLEDNLIKDVGIKKVKVLSTNNQNYAVPTQTDPHQIEVKPAPYATYKTYDYDYDGHEHTGVAGNFIVYIDENYKASEVLYDETDSMRPAISYTVKIKPMANYCWEGTDGDTSVKEVQWKIRPKQIAWFKYSNMMLDKRVKLNENNEIVYDENGNMVFEIGPASGVMGEYFTIKNIEKQAADGTWIPIPEDERVWVEENGGVWQPTQVGVYRTTIEAFKNYAWVEESPVNARVVTEEWQIETFVAMQPIFFEENLVYSGAPQSPEISLVSLDPGTYAFKEDGWWPGKQSGEPDINAPRDEQGYSRKATSQATHVGVYYMYAYLTDPAATWPDGSTDPYCLKWEIIPKTVELQFDANTWTYDSLPHNGTATITNLFEVDKGKYDFIYEDNIWTDHTTGHQFKIVGIKHETNAYMDYTLPDSGLEGTMVINKRPLKIDWKQLEFDHYVPGVVYEVDPEPSSDTICASDVGRVDFVVTNQFREDAGKQTVTASEELIGERAFNYILDENEPRTNTMIVKPAPLASVQELNPTYNGSEQTGLIPNEYCVFKSGTTSSTSANWNKAFTAVFEPLPNYAWSDYDTAEREFSWKMKRLPNTIKSNPTVLPSTEYDGESHTLVSGGSAKVGSLEFRYGTSQANAETKGWSTARPSVTNASDYYVQWRAPNAENYYASAASGGWAAITRAELADLRSYSHDGGGEMYKDSWKSDSSSLNMFYAKHVNITSGKVSQVKSAINKTKWSITGAPLTNYSWRYAEESSYDDGLPGNDKGKTGSRTTYYTVGRSTTAYFTPTNVELVSGTTSYRLVYSYSGVNVTGTTNKFTNPNTYVTATATPDDMHCWKDTHTVEPRQWRWNSLGSIIAS